MVNPKLFRYRIVPGHSFRMPDDTVKAGGEEIELDEESAKQHGGKLESLGAVEPDSGAGEGA